MLQLLHNLFLQLLYGLHDSLSIHKSFIFFVTSKTIQIRVIQCFLLNGVLFIGSLILYNYIISPVIYYLLVLDMTQISNINNISLAYSIQQYDNNNNSNNNNNNNITTSLYITECILWLVYRILWLYPIYTLSFILSTIWYQDIATHSYNLVNNNTSSNHKNNNATTKHKHDNNVSFEQWLHSMASECYKQCIYFIYFIQCELLGLLPSIVKYVYSKYVNTSDNNDKHLYYNIILYMSYLLYIIHLSCYYALYSYDYKWSMSKLSLLNRLGNFELYWLYYVGYGLPLTTITCIFPQFFNTGIFALLFPIFAILAIIAKPINQRFNKQSNTTINHNNNKQIDNTTISLPLFTIAKAVNYKLLRLINNKKLNK